MLFRSFIRDWITSRYLDQILQIIKSHRKEINRIEFSINEKKQDKTDEHSSLRNKNIKEYINQKVSFIKDSFLQYNRIDPNKNFKNFILGSSNKLAFEASKKVTQDLAHYNPLDRKSTRLNSSHALISYAVFCLKKKNQNSIS